MTHESIRRPENRQGTYARSFEETTQIHERIADNGIQFSLALYQMHEDLTELSNNMERGRKHWKQVGLTVEKKLHEAELLVDKVLPPEIRHPDAVADPHRPRLSMILPQRSGIGLDLAIAAPENHSV